MVGPIDISQWSKVAIQLYLDDSSLAARGTASLLVTSQTNPDGTPLIESVYTLASAAGFALTGSNSSVVDVCAKYAYVDYQHTSGSAATTPKVVVSFK